jgi:hypothetical protein
LSGDEAVMVCTPWTGEQGRPTDEVGDISCLHFGGNLENSSNGTLKICALFFGMDAIQHSFSFFFFFQLGRLSTAI